jgi:hypothetical protein
MANPVELIQISLSTSASIVAYATLPTDGSHKASTYYRLRINGDEFSILGEEARLLVSMVEAKK